RNQVAALFLLAPAPLTLTALPSTAAVQAATPQVFSFEGSSEDGLDPGLRLHFRVEGTPDSRASIRIAGDANAGARVGRAFHPEVQAQARIESVFAGPLKRKDLRRGSLDRRCRGQGGEGQGGRSQQEEGGHLIA